MTIQCTIDKQTQRTLRTQNSFWGSVQAKVAALRAVITKKRQQKIDRDAFGHLLALDNEMLDDIGVSRSDVEWANALPMHKSASKELERLARGDYDQRQTRARPKRRR